MPDDFKDYDYESELPGNKGLRAFHKALASAGKACKKALATIEEPDVRAHLGEHEQGLGKALKAMAQLHGKKYKGTPPLPDDYPDEEEAPLVTKEMEPDGDEFSDTDMDGKAVDGGMSYEDDAEGGGVLGVRPEDEDAAEEMSDDEYEHLRKSLPALERRLGLR